MAAKRKATMVAPPAAQAGNPLLFAAYFPHGYPHDAPPHFVAGRRAAPTKRGQLMLLGRSGRVTYACATTGGECALPNPVQQAVGVLDADGNVLAFHPLAGAGGRALRMDVVVDGVDYGPPAWEQAAEETAEGRVAARLQLDVAYATAKRRRQQAKIAASRGAGGGESLPAAAADMDAYFRSATRGELTSAQLTARLAEVRNIPAHVPGAAEAAGAYPLALLADGATLEALPWRDLLRAGRDASLAAGLSPPPPPYVLSLLTAALGEAAGGGRAAAEECARAAAYLALLMRFALEAPRSFRAGWLSEAPGAGAGGRGGFGAPPRAAAHLRARFTEGEAGSEHARLGRPQALVDLLMGTVCVLALRLSSPANQLDFVALAAALKTPAVGLVKHLTSLGCKIRRPAGAPARAVLMADAAEGQTLASFLPATYTRATAKKKA